MNGHMEQQSGARVIRPAATAEGRMVGASKHWSGLVEAWMDLNCIRTDEVTELSWWQGLQGIWYLFISGSLNVAMGLNMLGVSDIINTVTVGRFWCFL